ncbi:MAG: ABC transporter ATP-binding protein [Peptostreptococcales bacterium]
MKIDISKLSYSYNGKKDVFRNVSFSMHAGEIISIIGPNGIGKTTLLNCIMKLITPTSGEIWIEGKDMMSMSYQEVAQAISFVPQSIIPSFDYSVLEYVVTGCAPRLGVFERPKEKHYALAKDAIEQMEITHLIHKPYTKLSGGELQLVSIARAITQQAKIILMDEPTSHLDYGNQIKVLRLIKKMVNKGYGIILTTHNPDHALLLQGKVAAFDRNGDFHFGECNQILNEDLLHLIYGIPLHLLRDEEVNRVVCVAPNL